MSEILSNSITILVLLAGLAALVRFVRRDGFGGPGTGYAGSRDIKGFRGRPDGPADNLRSRLSRP